MSKNRTPAQFNINQPVDLQSLYTRLQQLEQENELLKQEIKQQNTIFLKHSDLFETASISLIRINKAGIIETINTKSIELLGIQEAELIGENILFLIHPDSKDILRDFINQVFQTHQKAPICKVKLSPTLNNQLDIAVKEVVVEDSQTCILSLRNISVNRSNQILVDDNQKLIELTDNLPVVVFETDLCGNLILCNSRALEWFGYTHNDLNSELKITQFFPNFEHQRLKDRFQLALSSPATVTDEYTAKRKNGTLFPVRIRSNAAYEGKKTIGVRGIIIDLSEQKKSEIAILEQNLKYKLLFDSAVQGIIYFDSESRIITANTSAERIFGMTSEQMKGLTPSSPQWRIIREDGTLFPAEERPVMNTLKSVQDNESIMGIYNPIINKYCWARVFAKALSLPGNKHPNQVYAIFEDITIQKEKEEKLQRINKRITALREIDHAIAQSGIENSEINEMIISQISELISCYEIDIISFDFESQEAVLESKLCDKVFSQQSNYRKPLSEFDTSLYSTGKTKYKQLSSETVSTETERQLLNLGIKSLIAIPLIANKQLIGIFTLIDPNIDCFSPEDIQIAEDIASQLSICFYQRNLKNELLKQTTKLEKDVKMRTQEIQNIMNFQHAILDNSKIAIIPLSIDGKIISFNPAAETLTGYKAEEVVGKHSPAIFNDMKKIRDVAKNISYLSINPNPTDEELLINLPMYYFHDTIEAEIIRKDQIRIPILLNTTVLRNDEGKITGHVGFALDNTERKNAEARFRMQSAAFESFALSVIITDKDGNIQWVNPAFIQLTGYTAAETIGQKPNILKSNKHTPEIDKEIWDTILSGEVWNGEIIDKRKNGSLYYQECTITPVVDQMGKITNFIAQLVDVSYRKKIEKALRESEERWQFALDGSGLGVWDWNTQTNEEFFSAQWKKMLDYDEDEISNSAEEWRNRVHPDDLEKCYTEMDLYLSGQKEIYANEHRLKCKDGSYKWIFSRGKIVEMTKDGKPLRIIGTHSDITEQKIAEEKLLQTLKQEKELNELKSRFVSTTSHEFRTPLSSILLACDLLLKYRDKMDESKMILRFERIKDQTLHLSKIVEDILQLSKLQDKKMTFNPEPIELVSLCRNFVDIFNDEHLLKNRISFSSFKHEIKIQADSRLMRQILNNLLSNAVKYSPENPVIKLDIAQSRQNILLMIQDNGIGIPLEEQKHLFTPFFRASNASLIQGNGLGLSIIKEAIALHGGNISVGSNVHAGTTFIIELPESIMQ